jgi:hypothetical protein
MGEASRVKELFSFFLYFDRKYLMTHYPQLKNKNKNNPIEDKMA